jgi:hypothetical protein
VGETRVDLLHLLEDLRDAYAGTLEETILTEMVANALDSGASEIHLESDPAEARLSVRDDGAGMRRRDLIRYHDIAATTKTRGQGIGFAGVGIKLGLLVSHEVLTESRRGKTHIATRWHLASRHRAPWRWAPPSGVVTARGTAVTLRLQNPLSLLLDPGYLEAVVRRNFRPLLDPTFDPILGAHYPRGVAVTVNGRRLPRDGWPAAETAPIEVRLARKRKPSAVGFLVREAASLPEDQRGLGVSTFGKVIKQGWDWLGITPATPERIGGLVEAPALAECLTLNKADFVRSGPRGATYLAYRKAIQECVAQRLGEWGDARPEADDTRRRVARPLERDLERVLTDLADDFPLLATLVEQHKGGQRRLAMGQADGPAEVRAVVSRALLGQEERDEPRASAEPAEPAVTPDAGSASAAAGSEPPGPQPPGPEPSSAPPGRLIGPGGPRRPGRYGLAIQFESRPDDPELGRLIEATVYVNDGHPAYRRAVASRAEGYHLALTVALALAPLAAAATGEHAFVTAFLSRWGDAVERRPRGRRRR